MMRVFLVVFSALVLSAPAWAKSNVLFIAIDDLRPELGCYGVEAIHSPHIDALAKKGVMFERAYCQLAVCNPSRVSLLTGLRPDTTKVWRLDTRFRETTPDAVTLPQYFKQQGYTTLGYGKIFHNPWPDNVSWSEPHAWPKAELWSDQAKQQHKEFKDEMRAAGKSDAAIDRVRAVATEVVDLEDSAHIDGAIAEQAIAALKRVAKRDKPFFVAAGFVRPHLPFVVPRKYWDLYDGEALALAENSTLPEGAPVYAMNTMYELRDYMDFLDSDDPRDGSLTLAEQRRLKHGYYASVSFIDAQVGKLMAALDTEGLSETTTVVLWSDHGWKLGEHNSWCKQSNYEIDARVPLIVYAPGAKGNGTRCSALVELLDVYPTLCALADLPVPAVLEGRSLAPLLAEPDTTWTHPAFNQFPRMHQGMPLMGYAMRTDQYRYVEWQNQKTREVVERELYDHHQSAEETRNIASEHQSLVASLSERMWEALPAPPKYVPRQKARPQMVFKNEGDVPLKLFWLPDDGAQRLQGTIAPGKQMLQNSTKGHRFKVEGPDGFRKVLTVRKQKQTVLLRP